MKILCRTLFDCSQTGVTGSFKPSHVPFTDQTGAEIADIHDWNRSRNQQRNFETIVQIISLRGQPNNISNPECINGSWQFTFEIDTPGVYSTTGDLQNLDALKNECMGIPMIVNLREHHALESTLHTQGLQANIWFETVNN
jgi:hypothetical protein